MGESALSVRAAGAEDMPAVAAIFEHYVKETVISFELDPPSVEDWSEKRRDLGAAGWPFLAAILGGEVIGFAYVAAWRNKPAYCHTVENTIYLAPGHVGRGYGQRLLAALLTHAREAGARQVIAVIAETGSQASMALHQRAGFRDAGRLQDVGFKHDQWVDVRVMQLALGDHEARAI